MLPGSAVPANAGAAAYVTSSVLLDPLSLAAARSGAGGAAGAAVSIVMVSVAEAVLPLPAASVAVAVMLRVPSARAEETTPYVPDPAPLPTSAPSLKIFTVLPTSAPVPAKDGVLSLVRSSVSLDPLSL